MNTFHSFGPFLKRLRSNAPIDPARDWLIALSLSLVALAGVIVWSIWTFDTVAGGGTLGAPVVKAPAVFDNSSIDTIHAIFVNRAAEEAKYTGAIYRFADPS